MCCAKMLGRITSRATALSRIRWVKRLASALATLLAIYSIEYVFFSLYVSGLVPGRNWRQPFPGWPLFIYLGWDANLYRHFFDVGYDNYFWPPLYIYALRLTAFIFHLSHDRFAQSALLVNLFSHLAIILAVDTFTRRDPKLQHVRSWFVVFLIFFYPGHNVFFAAYSESLYLALTIWTFILLERDHRVPASVLAGISALVRTMGTFVIGAICLQQLLWCWRNRRIDWNRLVGTLPGLLIIGWWHGILWWRGTGVLQSNAEWTAELIKVHIPPGVAPRWWVLGYLTCGPHWEVLAFWVGVAAAGYCYAKRRYGELFYILLFYFSVAIYTYRPFPWSRFVSVLFPIYFMAADWVKRKPRLAMCLVALSCVITLYVQIELFAEHVGEP